MPGTHTRWSYTVNDYLSEYLEHKSHRREGSPVSVKYDILSRCRSSSPFFSTAKIDFLSSEQL